MIKRLFDCCIAVFFIVLLSPVAFLVAIAVWRNMGSPVLFKQLRPGLHGKIFPLFKFRSMNNAVDREGISLPDEDRLTRLGGWLRRLSLDELPQLINVLRGEMSLVGPRPLLVEYLPLYSAEQARRHEVRPGITGWAQVNGRNALSWEQKFALDVWYVDNQSFWLDIKILFLTVKKVLGREGVSHQNEVTMPRFTGNIGENQ